MVKCVQITVQQGKEIKNIYNVDDNNDAILSNIVDILEINIPNYQGTYIKNFNHFSNYDNSLLFYEHNKNICKQYNIDEGNIDEEIFSNMLEKKLTCQVIKKPILNNFNSFCNINNFDKIDYNYLNILFVYQYRDDIYTPNHIHALFLKFPKNSFLENIAQNDQYILEVIKNIAYHIKYYFFIKMSYFLSKHRADIIQNKLLSQVLKSNESKLLILSDNKIKLYEVNNQLIYCVDDNK